MSFTRGILVAALLVTPALADPVIIEDFNFASVGTQWLPSSAFYFDQNDCGHNDTRAPARQNSGGNPGAYLQLSLTIGQSFGPCFVASQGQAFYAFNGAAYNPAAQGAIDRINYTDSRRLISGSSTFGSELFAFALKQGNNIFICTSDLGTNSSSWINVSLSSLTANSFSTGSFSTTRPDFSAAGQPIQFGIFQAGVSVPFFATTIEHNLDNFRVEIIPVAVNTCPADLTGDDFVDDSDFVLFAQAYGLFDCNDPAMPANCPADFNGDSFVDDTDFVSFAQAYSDFTCP